MVKKLILLLFILTVFMALPSILTTSAKAEQDYIIWSRGADVPLPRGGYFAAWYRGGLWLAGGSYWKDGKKLWTDETSFYNPKNRTWSKLKPLPRPFGYGVTASVGKDLYLLGGVDGEGNVNKDIYRWRGDSWSKIGESPTGFIYAAYSTIGSKVYVFGGSKSPTDVTKATNETWVYESKNNKWEQLNAIPGEPRQIFSAAAVGKNIYLFGGVTQKVGEKFYNLGDAYRFETATGKWTSLKNLPQPMRAFWATAVGKNIYLFGGFGEAGLDTVYRYTPVSNTYELVSKLPQPLMDTKFIFNDGKFYGATGEDKLVSRFPGMVIGQLHK